MNDNPLQAYLTSLTPSDKPKLDYLGYTYYLIDDDGKGYGGIRMHGRWPLYNPEGLTDYKEKLEKSIRTLFGELSVDANRELREAGKTKVAEYVSFNYLSLTENRFFTIEQVT